MVNPKTAATFRVLELFELLQYESKLSTYEFYQKVAYTDKITTASQAMYGIQSGKILSNMRPATSNAGSDEVRSADKEEALTVAILIHPDLLGLLPDSASLEFTALQKLYFKIRSFGIFTSPSWGILSGTKDGGNDARARARASSQTPAKQAVGRER